MARIKYSPIITSIAGSVGNATFQRNKFGNTLRTKPLPRNPASEAQYNVRQKMVTLQAAWKALTDAQRLQWNRFLDFSGQATKHDKSIKLSGQALFMKYQMFRLISNCPLLTTIEYSAMPEVERFNSIILNGAALEVHFDGARDVDVWFYFIRLTAPRPANKIFSKQGLIRMLTAHSDIGAQNCATTYLRAFGVLPNIGDFLHYAIQYYSYTAPVYSGVSTGVAEVQ